MTTRRPPQHREQGPDQRGERSTPPMTSCSGPRNLFIRELTAVHTRPPSATAFLASIDYSRRAFLVDTPALDHTSVEDGLPLLDRRVYRYGSRSMCFWLGQ